MLFSFLFACARPTPPTTTGPHGALQEVSAALEKDAQALLRCKSVTLPEPHPVMGAQISECPPVVLSARLGGQEVGLPVLPEYVHPPHMRQIGVSWLLRVQAPSPLEERFLHLLSREEHVFLLGIDDLSVRFPHQLVRERDVEAPDFPLPAGLDSITRDVLSSVAEHTLSYEQCSALFAPWQCAPDGLYSRIPPEAVPQLQPETALGLLQADVLFWDERSDRMVGITLQLGEGADFWVQAVDLQITPGEHPLVLPHPGASAEAYARTAWCELSWPWTAVSADIDRDCMHLLLASTYGVSVEALVSGDATNYDPGPLPKETRYSARDLQGMRQRVAAWCPEPDFDADRVCVRTLEAIDLSIRRKASLQEDINMMSFAPQLCRILDGERLTEADMYLQTELRWSDLTRAKMAAAVKIRQGYQPVSEDQKALFLRPAADAEAACLPIGPPPGEARLPDAVDRHNQDMIDRGRR